MVVVSSAEQLASYVLLLEDLAANAVEANAFYEPFFMLRAFAGSGDLSLVLVFGPDPVQPTRPRVLHGFFPLEARAGFRGFPLNVAALWGHDFISIRTPLVRAGSAAACLRAVFDWVASERADCDCVELGDVAGDGPFSHHLTDYLNATRRTVWVASAHTRAMFRPAADAEVYLRAALAGKHLKEVRRHERLLSEDGSLHYTSLGAAGDLQPWLDDFLHVPVTFPHWLKNQDNVSVSFSITFRTPASERREVVYQMNSALRRLPVPVRPMPFGRAAWRDGVKFQAYRAYRLARRALPFAGEQQGTPRY